MIQEQRVWLSEEDSRSGCSRISGSGGGRLRNRASLRGLFPSACGQRGGIHQDDPLLGVFMRTSVSVGSERVCRFFMTYANYSVLLFGHL